MNVGDYFAFDGVQKLKRGTLKEGNEPDDILKMFQAKRNSKGTYKIWKADGRGLFYHEMARKAIRRNHD